MGWSEWLSYFSGKDAAASAAKECANQTAKQTTWGDWAKYLAYENPVSRTVVDSTVSAAKGTKNIITQTPWGEWYRYLMAGPPRSAVDSTVSVGEAAAAGSAADAFVAGSAAVDVVVASGVSDVPWQEWLGDLVILKPIKDAAIDSTIDALEESAVAVAEQAGKDTAASLARPVFEGLGETSVSVAAETGTTIRQINWADLFRIVAENPNTQAVYNSTLVACRSAREAASDIWSNQAQNMMTAVRDNPVTQLGLDAIVTSSYLPKHAAQPTVVQPLWSYVELNSEFFRLSGLSGATAVLLSILGAVYIEMSMDDDAKKQMHAKKALKEANNTHFVHTFAMLAVPMAHYPKLTGSLLLAGTVLHTGPMYYRALTDDRTYDSIALYGTFLTVAGWMSFVL